jgi:hypothetical protein
MINGVSQQPFSLRLASQCEEQINAYSSIVEGLTKRPPTRHVARLLNQQAEGAFIHIINRDAGERYVVVIFNGDLSVFDFNGNPISVAFPNGKGYLTGTDVSFRAVTVADYTFILNKSQPVALDPYTFPTRPPEALVAIRAGNYQATYTITLNGVNHSYTTAELDATTIQTNNIAAQLQAAINTHWGSVFTVVRVGSTLHIKRDDNTDFTITTADGQSDNAMLLVKNRVQSFTDLPKRAVDGYQVEISGAPSNRFDNYYVAYDGTGGASGAGIWKEIPRPGRQTRLNKSTMPHALVRLSDGTFSFQVIDWDECQAGDENLITNPSFVGNRIQDVFFFRNRLGFVSDENVNFSRSGDFFNFFRATVTDLLPTDPIDVAVSHVKVSLLRHAVPFSESLLLFSDQTQFIVSGAEALSPATISIDQTTEFETSSLARPVGAGSFVYFCTNKGGFTGVREYYTDASTKVNDANEVTAHVPRYVPKDVFKLTASTNENIIIALTREKRNELFVYQYYYSGQEKVQSSWSRWVFPEGDVVLNAEFVESTLWIVLRRSDGIYLERMDIEPGLFTDGLRFNIHLDRRIRCSDCTKTYNPVTKRTTITLPYVDSGAYQAVVVENGPRPPGFILDGQWEASNQISVLGDYTTATLEVGRVYSMIYDFSPLLIRQEASGGGQVANSEGRIQLRRMLLNYADTGYFRILVTPSRRDTYEYRFTGRVLGSANTLLGESGIETGSFSFPIMSNNMEVKIQLINDTPLPSRLLNAEWEANFTRRTQRAT